MDAEPAGLAVLGVNPAVAGLGVRCDGELRTHELAEVAGVSQEDVRGSPAYARGLLGNGKLEEFRMERGAPFGQAPVHLAAAAILIVGAGASGAGDAR